MPKPSSELKTVTRKQLRGLGLSLYHAAAITKVLKPSTQQGSTYLYSAAEVIGSLRQYMQRSRIKATTRETLKTALDILLDLIGNVVPVAFGTSTDPELSRMTRELMTTISKTNSSLAALKIDAEIKVKSHTKPETT
ncbi:hypothetical protein C7B65_10610 [Phormidesmis priestleyi ULC007]|uniref:Uncharacterized protein n=1 Tax=Phormidesmis priestleyi ULC007 TaxID=1920490 RepID=A0A2T1DGY1_9CYAN|nr:hypothetical protein [Phormidesmis priestleyi]PSB19735.1 hypothetical protein C7B65_10610 [Phormidesmis priestleyi ULC007]PZO53619.1 MAG: hypothetical protein DCF14_04315 [Phormidesmis priestleyi]